MLRRKQNLTRRSLNSTPTTLKRSGQIPKKGRLSKLWENFRNAEFENDKDEEGLIRCQDYKIGLPRCGIARDEMDLHHTEGRDGKLLLDKSKMVWLTRECHQKAHEPKN